MLNHTIVVSSTVQELEWYASRERIASHIMVELLGGRTTDGLKAACRYIDRDPFGGRLLETEWLLTKIDERKLASDRISTFAATDEITGLANRAAFKDRLRHALADAGRGAPSFATLDLDLDRFQDVKSTHGHSAEEDVLLKSVAARLIGCARDRPCCPCGRRQVRSPTQI
jgi:predicted signal transduction protein with EAL and GGDEF domain